MQVSLGGLHLPYRSDAERHLLRAGAFESDEKLIISIPTGSFSEGKSYLSGASLSPSLFVAR